MSNVPSPANAVPYTQAEVSAVVQQLIQSGISYPLDTLGVRRTDLTFNDFQQAAAGLFVLFPNAPFYVLYLGAQRLQDAITSEAAILSQLLAAIQSLGNTTVPINDVSSLFNAQAALQNLGGAAGQRATSFSSVSQAPAFQQFTANTNAFLSGPGQNVKQNGQIVQTPQQARAAIPGLISQLQQSHVALIAQVTLLVNGIDNYNSISLPAVVSASVLANASSLIGSDAATLNSLTPDQRLAFVRQVVLNLLASQTAVATFCNFSAPSQFLAITGTGIPYSDANRLATPAVAEATIGGAVSILQGVTDDLNIALDGGAAFDVILSPSLIAELDGVQSDTGFIISDGTNPTPPAGLTLPANNIFRMRVGSVVTTTALTLSVDAFTPRTADQVVADINVGLPAGVEAQAYYQPLFYSGGLSIPAGTNTTWTIPIPGVTNLAALGVKATGCSVQVNDGGPNAGIYAITAVAADGSSITVSGTTVAQSNAQVTIGPVSRKVKILLTDPATQVPAETSLSVLGDTPASNGACTTLGFVAGITSSCKKTTPDQVAANINANTTKVKASTAVEYLLQGAAAHSNVLNINELVFAEAEATGTQAFVGTTLTYTITAIVDAGSVSIGDTIALRSGPNAGNGYAITTINGETSTLAPHVLAIGDVLIGSGSVVGTGAPSADAEFGPTLAVTKYDVVVIPSGPNAGTYFAGSNGATAIDVELLSPLPLAISGGQPSQITANYGVMFLTLASLNTTSLSAITVQGDGGGLFYSPVPFTQLGTTPWFQLPMLPVGLQAGDMLYTYATQYNEPSAIYEIIGVDTTSKVIQLQPDIPDGVSWVFTPQPPPYAAIAYGTANTYLVTQMQWEQWLAESEQQPLFFTNFNATLNQLLAASPPRAVDIGNAANTLNQLYALLQGAQAIAIGADSSLALDTISSAFTVEPVSAVDAMITTYTAKGSDLAIDTLLSGDFATFFGMSAEGSSYSGAMQSAIRSVAMSDLPVRKINRSDSNTSRILAQSESPDPEFTANTQAEQLQGDPVIAPASLGSGVPANFGTTIGNGGGT